MIARPSGCPHGCGPDGHEPDCGAEALLERYRLRRVEQQRRDQERRDRDRVTQRWVRILFRDVS